MYWIRKRKIQLWMHRKMWNDCIWSPYNDENNPKNKDKWEINLKRGD